MGLQHESLADKRKVVKQQRIDLFDSKKQQSKQSTKPIKRTTRERNEKAKSVCKHFIRGQCYRGNNCMYLHSANCFITGNKITSNLGPLSVCNWQRR